MFQEWILGLVVFVLLVYFFSSMNLYKSMYQKTKDELVLMQEDHKAMQNILKRYENQVSGSVSTIEQTQSKLKTSRAEVYELRNKLENCEHDKKRLKEQNESLYDQLVSMV